MRNHYGLGCVLLVSSMTYGIEPYTCRNGLFPDAVGHVSLAAISAPNGSPAYFRDDAAGCPQAGTCVTKAYLVKGDSVLIARQEAGWSCAWYFGKKDEFVGWLPSSSLTSRPAISPKPEDWLGIWKPINSDDVIHITHGSGAEFQIKGHATWHGAMSVHVGSVSASAAPSGDTLTVREGNDEYSCAMTMQLVSGNLVVKDNSNCGGMNVRFNDVYRKAK